eukprot:m.235540 g.235540  ORF g.235540 m.235540 type:complete len:615 (+) comp19341_c0_seq5:182-2026(+)
MNRVLNPVRQIWAICPVSNTGAPPFPFVRALTGYIPRAVLQQSVGTRSVLDARPSFSSRQQQSRDLVAQSKTKVSSVRSLNYIKNTISGSLFSIIGRTSTQYIYGAVQLLPKRGQTRGVSQQALGESALQSVVKIFTTSSPPNYFLPWTHKPQRESTGSGFVIEHRPANCDENDIGRRILTNAHCVADQTHVMVRGHGSPVRYIAEVEVVGHDCDLALLKVEDAAFWVNMPPLEIGTTPALQDRVYVAGYPRGGDTISISSGVVSRVEVQRYFHGGGTQLAVQIDAPINPGNSGGPALYDDGSLRVAGVAFQGMTNADGIGYIIPHPVIEHFLKDAASAGEYKGFVELGVLCQSLENPAIRNFYHVPPSLSGVVINEVHPISDLASVLQKGDVILEVDGKTVANDGTIAFRNLERVFMSHALSRFYLGDTIRVKVLRAHADTAGGSIFEHDIKLERVDRLVPMHCYDTPTDYFVHAGLVFLPLTYPYLYEWGDHWWSDAPRKLCMRASKMFKKKEKQQIVVLSQILMDRVNFGYDGLIPAEVTRFNGEPVTSLLHLQDMIQACTTEFLSFELDDDVGCKVVLDRIEAEESQARILEKYSLPHLRSVGLRNDRSE